MEFEPLQGVVVCLDDVPVDDLVGPVEVLVQEGLRTFSLPAGASAWADMTTIFGRRSRWGQHAVRSRAQVEAATEAEASFLLLDIGDGVAAAARETGIPFYPPAMTPTEIRSVLDGGATGAQLYPADVVGHQMAARLVDIGLAHQVVPRGGLGAFAVGEWMGAGSPAACVDTTLLSDALTGGDLGMLRDRVPAFIRAAS